MASAAKKKLFILYGADSLHLASQDSELSRSHRSTEQEEMHQAQQLQLLWEYVTGPMNNEAFLPPDEETDEDSPVVRNFL